MNILISGIGGHMGAELEKLTCTPESEFHTVAGVDLMADQLKKPYPVAASYDALAALTDLKDVDCIVDFSHHSSVPALTAFAVRYRLPLIIATTGHSEEEIALIREAAKEIPLFWAANFSLGIALLIELAKKAAQALPDAEIEIIEKHHDRKVDAPSGTALAIAEALKEVRPEATLHPGRSGFGKRTPQEIGLHAIRMGNIVGEHEVIIGTQNQTITLKHEAHSRAPFAEGTLSAARFLAGKPAGLYSMQDLVK